MSEWNRECLIFKKYKFIYFNWRLITLQYCIGFAIHQHESATGMHVLPILNPSPSCLPISSLWVVSVHQPQASGIMHQTRTSNPDIGKTLSDIHHSRILHDPPPRILEIKVKINKWDLIKLKSFCTTKETISKVKRQPSGLSSRVSQDPQPTPPPPCLYTAFGT